MANLPSSDFSRCIPFASISEQPVTPQLASPALVPQQVPFPLQQQAVIPQRSYLGVPLQTQYHNDTSVSGSFSATATATATATASPSPSASAVVALSRLQHAGYQPRTQVSVSPQPPAVETVTDTTVLSKQPNPAENFMQMSTLLNSSQSSPTPVDVPATVAAATSIVSDDAHSEYEVLIAVETLAAWRRCIDTSNSRTVRRFKWMWRWAYRQAEGLLSAGSTSSKLTSARATLAKVLEGIGAGNNNHLPRSGDNSTQFDSAVQQIVYEQLPIGVAMIAHSPTDLFGVEPPTINMALARLFQYDRVSLARSLSTSAGWRALYSTESYRKVFKRFLRAIATGKEKYITNVVYRTANGVLFQGLETRRIAFGKNGLPMYTSLFVQRPAKTDAKQPTVPSSSAASNGTMPQNVLTPQMQAQLSARVVALQQQQQQQKQQQQQRLQQQQQQPLQYQQYHQLQHVPQQPLYQLPSYAAVGATGLGNVPSAISISAAQAAAGRLVPQSAEQLPTFQLPTSQQSPASPSLHLLAAAHHLSSQGISPGILGSSQPLAQYPAMQRSPTAAEAAAAAAVAAANTALAGATRPESSTLNHNNSTDARYPPSSQ
jgi:hypothetical protein